MLAACTVLCGYTAADKAADALGRSMACRLATSAGWTTTSARSRRWSSCPWHGPPRLYCLHLALCLPDVLANVPVP